MTAGASLHGRIKKAFVLGQFDVTPGSQTGAGGFVEVSSGDTLTFGGNAKTGIDKRTGTLLLDPKNITIADTTVYDPTSYMIGVGYTGGNNKNISDADFDGDGDGDYTTNDNELGTSVITGWKVAGDRLRQCRKDLRSKQ